MSALQPPSEPDGDPQLQHQLLDQQEVGTLNERTECVDVPLLQGFGVLSKI